MHTRALFAVILVCVAFSGAFAPAMPRAQAAEPPRTNLPVGRIHKDNLPFRSENPAYPVATGPTAGWNTFLGSDENYDNAAGIALDADGNMYIIGQSAASWGLPERPFNTGSYDAFVAKLDSNGTLLWNTFLGGPGLDTGAGIALDGYGNVYVTGFSNTTWGDNPLLPYDSDSAYVAKLDNDGVLQWNTFLGSNYSDSGFAIALDASGNVFAAGSSFATWGTVNPRPYTAAQEGFVAQLNGDGDLQWTTFLGGIGYDSVSGLVADASGNIFAVGSSNWAWGSPVREFSAGNLNAFVAKLNSSGSLQWHTFLGSSAGTGGSAIVLDGDGNTYVSGNTNAAWAETPRRPYSAGLDGFVARLDGSGSLEWYTLLGGTSIDSANDLSLDNSGNLVVIGESGETWGEPIWPFLGTEGASDVALTKLNNNGDLVWNTFLGSDGPDYGTRIAVDGSGAKFIAGESASTWGSPLEPFHGLYPDAFVGKIGKANSTTTLTGHSPSTSVPGQTVTIGFTVTADPPGSLTPTGSVIVDAGGGETCAADVSTGHCDLAFTTAGTKNLTATFGGDSDFDGSSSTPLEHQVIRAGTTISITGHMPASSVVGQDVTVTWAVNVTPPGTGTPSGTVTVSSSSGDTCAADVSTGQCTLSFASAGSKNLTAAYTGDDNFLGSSSPAVAHVVNRVSTTITITGHTPSTSVVGETFTVTWAISMSAPASNTPSGTVTVDDGNGNTCTANVAAGQCVLVSSSPGIKTLMATYTGDSEFAGSSSTATHEVRQNTFRLFLPLIVR